MMKQTIDILVKKEEELFAKYKTQIKIQQILGTPQTVKKLELDRFQEFFIFMLKLLGSRPITGDPFKAVKVAFDICEPIRHWNPEHAEKGKASPILHKTGLDIEGVCLVKGSVGSNEVDIIENHANRVVRDNRPVKWIHKDFIQDYVKLNDLTIKEWL